MSTKRAARQRRGHTTVAKLVMIVAIVATAMGLSLAPPLERAAAAPPAVVAPPGSRGWIFTRLAEADALLRRGRPRAAARAFREVVEQTQGTEVGTLAELGLAWSVATSGDVELGRALAADAHASAGVTAPTTGIVLGLLSARAGDQKTALASLDEATRMTPDPAAGRVVALARAYVLFWSSDFGRAASAFDAVAAAAPDGPLADDARYGAAWSRHRRGEVARAHADLAAMVADAPAGHVFHPVSQRLVELDARAILGSSIRRQRRAGVHSPEADLARLLDGDGWSRARAALRSLERGPASEARSAAAAAPAEPAPFAPVGELGQGRLPEAPGAPAPAASIPAAPRRTTLPLAGALLTLLALIGLALVWARHGKAVRARPPVRRQA